MSTVSFRLFKLQEINVPVGVVTLLATTGDSDESYLTINMVEEGSYSGHLLIDNVLSTEFSGDYANGILNAVQQDNNSEGLLYELEISFQSGRAIVTITAAKIHAVWRNERCRK